MDDFDAAAWITEWEALGGKVWSTTLCGGEGLGKAVLCVGPTPERTHQSETLYRQLGPGEDRRRAVMKALDVRIQNRPPPSFLQRLRRKARLLQEMPAVWQAEVTYALRKARGLES